MTEKRHNPIPPWQRIAVDATTAAHMLSVSRSTFFLRVKIGMYPKAGPGGRWRVSDLRRFAEGPPAETEASSTTTP